MPALTSLDLYGSGLRAGARPVARTASGGDVPLPWERWLGVTTPADDAVLARAAGPVLDVGCGPGRHVHALARRGVLALGLDISPVAVELARRRGAVAVEGDVFRRVPGHGTWRSVLLLDGNIGIGGDPGELLARVRGLLRPGGVALVEFTPGIGPGWSEPVRLELDGVTGEWFRWAEVDRAEAADVAARAGFRLIEAWEDEGRCFGALASRA